MRIGIVGFGVVGQNMHKIFPDAVLIDPPKGLNPDYQELDLAFICVPTDKLENGEPDTSIVEKAMRSVRAKHYCLKSTVPPGTTDRLGAQFKSVAFSPEYWGATVNANNHDYDFLIVGGDFGACRTVADAYKPRFTGRLKIFYTDAKTAELTKYMENTYLAMMVVFYNEMYRIAEAMGVNYDMLRELHLLDPRTQRSHTVVYRDQPFFSSHCLDKDVPGLVWSSEQFGYSPEVIKKIIEVNDKWKAKFKSTRHI